LYGVCHWDERTIRRLVADGKIAARLKGVESPDSSSDATEECPICFLSYNAVNITRCCHAVICTECFLQVRPQKEKDSTCPFCNCGNFSVEVAKKDDTSSEDVPGAVSSSSSSLTASSSSNSCKVGNAASAKKKSAASVAPDTPPPAKNTAFGSELEKDERFKLLKKRSESFASASGTSTPKKDKEIIESIAMTPEERQRLEEEMKAQHYHPLVLKLENEAQERRLENDRAYERTNHSRNSSSRRLRVRGGSARSSWDNVAMEQDGAVDDMATLERFMMFTMGEENRGNERSSANRGQQEGFPLLRSLLTGHVDSNTASSNRTSGWIRRQRALNTVGLMMLSEEEQVAMAIAASMRDQDQNNSSSSSSSDSNEDEDDNEESTGIGADTGSNDGGIVQSHTNTSNDVSESESRAVNDSAASVTQTNGDEASTITELARVVSDIDTCEVQA
jgi:hypothetical protein